MCTITFIPKPDGGFILTSNRDEAPGRDTLPPKIYEEDATKLLYPKDAVAGGTWIGISDKHRVVCLMNGGFVAHERKPTYRKSRGLVVKDWLKATDLNYKIEKYNFLDIEPFTAVVVVWRPKVKIFQIVWDGTVSHFSEEPSVPQIWSSSPLYPQPLQLKRERWFSDFLLQAENPSEEQILQFHKTAGEGDPKVNLVMDRGFIKTKSITQISKHQGKVQMYYEDLQSGMIQTTAFDFKK